MIKPSNLLHIYLATSLAYFAGFIYAEEADQSENSETLFQQLPGRWQGTLEGGLRVQPVSWRFLLNSNGNLVGYMGPRVEGMPRVAMDNLVVTEAGLSFNIDDQHAEFNGHFIDGALVGTWRQGLPAKLVMRKKDFIFDVTPAVSDSLVGNWLGSIAGTRVELEFKQEKKAGFVSGNLSIPSLDIADAPMVDIYSGNDNLLAFYTDNGRSFSGNLVGYQMQGDYRANRRTYKGDFTNITQMALSQKLTVSEEIKQQLLGRWTGFSSVEFNFIDNEKGDFGGVIRASGDYAPVISIDVNDEKIEILTENERYFSGSLIDGKLQGQYRYPDATVTTTFEKQ